jgi:hypothetical protein
LGEAQAIAKTKEDVKIVNSVMFAIDEILLGQEAAFKNLERRRKANNE